MGRKGEKKIALWKYVEGTVVIPVPVFLVNQDEKGKHYGDAEKPGTYFRVSVEDPDIEDEDTNIDALKQRVFSTIKSKLTINWQPMLHVTVDGDRDRLYEQKKGAGTLDTSTTGGGKLSVGWKRYQVATIGSKQVHRHFESYYEPHDFNSTNKSKKLPGREHWGKMGDGWPDVGQAKNSWSGKKSRLFSALVADTPENRQALEDIADAIQALHGRLAQLLGTESAAKTLEMISASGLAALSVKMLPSAKGE